MKMLRKMMYFTSPLVLVASFSFADGPRLNGNGGGYNGPDLSGQSIPILLDRSLTHADVIRAYDVCWAETFKDIWTQVHKRNFPEAMKPFEGVFVRWDQSLSTMYLSSPEPRKPFAGRVQISATGYGVIAVHSSVEPEVNPRSIYFRLPDSKLFPRYIFEFRSFQPGEYTEQTASHFDRFGRIVSKKIELTRVTLKVPDHYSTVQALENGANGAITSVTVNIPKLTECLRTEISH